MACNCKDHYGSPTDRCLGTCDKQKIIITLPRPERYYPKVEYVPPSPYMFDDGIKLVGYDTELQNSIKYKGN